MSDQDNPIGGEMNERLRPRDLAFLVGESASTPMHNATVEIFDPASSSFDYDRLVALVGDRIAFVPRYRQKITVVPGRLANPVWTDDADFDLAYHVRRSALPRPGSMEQLRELVQRIISRPLDRDHPLWEVYFVEGLADGKVAVLSKSHQVLVDGVETVDLAQVLLDRTPQERELGGDEAWHPRSTPSTAALLAGALHDAVSSPVTVVDTARSTTGSLFHSADAAAKRVGATAAALTNRRTDQSTPIAGSLSRQRRFVTLVTDLADYRTVRDVHGGTVNDVILATVTGALRRWLMTRAESLGGRRSIRAVVPISVLDQELDPTSLGTQIAAHLVELPIGEASPVVRLHQVSYSFKVHKESGRAVAADRIAGIAGFAPSTFHAIGSRVAAGELRRGFQLTVTNVPGPQTPLYADGAVMLETYPVPPLLPGHALAVSVTSYDGRVFYGLTADRDLVPDAETLSVCLRDSLDELLDTATGVRPSVPRGRKKSVRKPQARS